MLPVIAIIGRPNVGKSSLFNCITQSRDALVADQPGVTRDRLYGKGKLGDRPYFVIDSGGLVDDVEQGMDTLTENQTLQAIKEADQVLFLVDAREGLTSGDQRIARLLRKMGRPAILVVNKCEGLDTNVVCSDFYALGLGEPHPISAAHRRGVEDLIDTALQSLPAEIKDSDAETAEKRISIAIIGRPNVGKSTLVNRMLGEERVVVFNQPGTTRDSIYIDFDRRDKHYTLIDTAGVRRRHSVTETIEKFSVIKTLQAIERADVIILLMDASENIADQDLHLLGFVLDAGKALVVAVNKWDGLSTDKRDSIHKEIDRRLTFVPYAKVEYISALHGTGVGNLFPLVDEAYASFTKKLPTPELTRVLEEAIAGHEPPLVQGRRIKLRYAHSGGSCPPLIIIHGKQTTNLPDSYRRYLSACFRKAFNLVGTPIKIEFRDAVNPYHHKK